MPNPITLSLLGSLYIVVGVGCVEDAAVPEPRADGTVRASEALQAPQQAIDYTLHWCTPDSPLQGVNKSVTCEGCNRNGVEDCARAAANTAANSFCATQIQVADGAAACDPATFTGDICVDDTATGVTSAVQFGSDTACGIWPFRHAKWRVTYRVQGNCGFDCSEAL